MTCPVPGCVKQNGPAHQEHEDERGARWTTEPPPFGAVPTEPAGPNHDGNTEPIEMPLVPDDDLEQPL